jgi:hypothetical protein
MLMPRIEKFVSIVSYHNDSLDCSLLLVYAWGAQNLILSSVSRSNESGNELLPRFCDAIDTARLGNNKEIKFIYRKSRRLKGNLQNGKAEYFFDFLFIFLSTVFYLETGLNVEFTEVQGFV